MVKIRVPESVIDLDTYSTRDSFWLHPIYREWFAERNHKAPKMFSENFYTVELWLELPEDLAVEFTLRWL